MRTCACPTPQQLSNWINGTIDEASSAELEMHLEVCPACRNQIERLDSSDDLLDDLRMLPPQPVMNAVDGDRLARLSMAFLAGQQAETIDYPSRIRDYEILNVLGEGGMGTVFRARHLPLNRLVALKILPPDSGHRVARFQRELAHHGPLDHPHIVRALDAGEAEGIHFLVTELVEGKNAAQFVAEQQRLPLEQACDIVRQAALGLAYLHQRGLVHRDVKPSNLMIDASGHVRLLDLGLVTPKDDSDGDDRMTKDHVILGTPDYIAPEQIVDPRRADSRADLYGLGCTFFHLLTGKPPFASYSLLQKLHAHQYEEPDMTTLLGLLPKPIYDLLTELLSKRADDRPATADAVAQRLASLSSAAITQKSVRPMPIRTVSGASPVSPAQILEPIAKPKRTHRLSIALLALVVLILTVPLAWFGRTKLLPFYSNDSGSQSALPDDKPTTPQPVSDAQRQAASESSAESQLQLSVSEDKSESQTSVNDQVAAQPAEPKQARQPSTAPFRLGAHSQPVTAIAYTQSNEEVVSAGAHQFEPVRVWNLRQRKQVDSWTPGAVAAMAFSMEDKNRILLGIGYKLTVWDRVRKTESSALTCQGTLTCVAVAKENGIVAVGTDRGEVVLWDAAKSTKRAQVALADAVTSIAVSSTGDLVAAATVDKRVSLWNAKQDEVIATIDLADQAIQLSFSADGAVLRMIEGYSDRHRSTIQRLLLADARGTVLQTTLIAEQGEMSLAAAFHDDAVLIGYAGGNVKHWTLRDQECTIDWNQNVHTAPVAAIAIASDGSSAVSGGRDGSVFLIDFASK